MLATILAGALALAATGTSTAATDASAGKAGGADDEVVVIQVPQGVIVAKLFTDAPKTVANFKDLVRKGFYNGTTFHRIVPGFVIQGGDPNSKDSDLSNDGMGGDEVPTIPGEFSMVHKHVRGTLSMARKADPNSASCQFFICLAPAPSLDGKYAAFGQVIQGQEVVDKIADLATDPSVSKGQMGANPGKKAVMQKVTLETMAKWSKPATAAAKTDGKTDAKPAAAPAAKDSTAK